MQTSQHQLLSRIADLRNQVSDLKCDEALKERLIEALICLEFIVCCHITLHIEKVLKQRLG